MTTEVKKQSPLHAVTRVLKKNTMVVALVAVMVLFELLIVFVGGKPWSQALLTPANITNLISQNSYVVILAVGMLMCILTGGNIDLSVGSVVALVGAVVCALFVASQVITRIKRKRKNYETQGMMAFAVKIIFLCAVIMALAIFLGLHKGLPTILILLAVIVLVYGYYTANTVPGRHLYAMGGNEKAAKLSGINTNRTMFFAYTNMAFLAAVAALVVTARFNSAAPSAGNSYELDAIGACFIGGASAYGGTGTVGGAVIGAVFMGVINNGMSILGVDSNWQKAVKGLVLLAAVIFDVVSKRRSQAE